MSQKPTHSPIARRQFLRQVSGVATGAIAATCLNLDNLSGTYAAPANEANNRARGSIGLLNHTADDELTILIASKPAITYQYGDDLDLPHYYPVRGPSGRSMTVQRTEPFPHHRSFWFGDRVQLEGQPALDTYNAWYSKPEDQAGGPFAQRVRHVAFSERSVKGDMGLVESRLVWEFADGRHVLNEKRVLRVWSLGRGEYLLDLDFTLTANFGRVTFISDAVHYAWPYIRMNDAYSVEGGGRIVNSSGGVNQEGTNDKRARWVDYSNTIEGETEGLAMFVSPMGEAPLWLTRDYGCFGPRREAARSGKRFTLDDGESISQRVGVLVHRGDAASGNVKERYEDWAKRIGEAKS